MDSDGELSIKIADIIGDIVGEFNSGGNIPDIMKTCPDQMAQIMQAIRTEYSELERAYGGCHSCYGKGYATVNDRWHGHDTDTDIGSPGGHVSGGEANAMKFCTCDRGQQLKSRFDRYISREAVEAAIGNDEDYPTGDEIVAGSLNMTEEMHRIDPQNALRRQLRRELGLGDE